MTKTGRSSQHTYRERPQPANRRRFGLLEKKKDWKLRAQDFKKKKETLLKLKRTAENKNPDEFYMGMVGKNLKKGKFLQQEGKHKLNLKQTGLSANSKKNSTPEFFQTFENSDDEEDYLDELLSKAKKKKDDADEKVEKEINFDDVGLFKNFDINFVRMKYTKENNKLKKMQNEVNFSNSMLESHEGHDDSESENETGGESSSLRRNHTFFASDSDEAEQIEIQRQQKKKQAKKAKKEFGKYKKTASYEGFSDDNYSQKLNQKMLTKYRDLSEQIDKVESIKSILGKLENRRKVAIDKRMAIKVCDEEGNESGQYKWMTKRYR